MTPEATATVRPGALSTDLLTMVFARPHEARAGALALLSSGPTPFEASVAHHAIGLVERDFGDLGVAVRRLRRALAWARLAESDIRETDVLASLGIALIRVGRTADGLTALDDALGRSRGAPAARVRFRRGAALWVLGRHHEALRDARTAVPVLRRAGDAIWTARALSLRALTGLALGDVDRADADLRVAERLFDGAGQDHDAAVTRHNRGLVAFRAGDLPTALARLDEADERYRVLGTPMPELVIDRCTVLLAAGLPHDALALADAATVHLRHLPGQPTHEPELLLVAARAALADGDPGTARERAGAAARSFAAQRRQWWHAHARLLVLQARFATAPATARLTAQTAAVAARLRLLGSPEAVQASLLAGRVALAAGRPAEAGRHLAGAAMASRHGPTSDRVDGWVAHALTAEFCGTRPNTRRTLLACRRGLDLLDGHQLTLGALELRARATAQGAELAELAQRICLRTGQTRRLLEWSDRRRATACAVPSVRPPDDHAVRGDLAALREIVSRQSRARADGSPRPALDRERRRLERRIRARSLRAAGAGIGPAGGAAGLDVTRLLRDLDGRTLLEIVDIDGALHVLICRDGRVRRLPAGSSAAAVAHVETARWALLRIAMGVARATPERINARLDTIGGHLERELLGRAAAHLGDGPIVIVPPGRLHAVPWALLPSLADRVHGIAPSASAWLRAAATPPPPSRVVVVCGPNLLTHGGEVDGVARLHGGPQPIRDGAATAAAVLDAIDGSSLAHIAAHGTFRADNPLFSAIHLDDGPLTVYDLERLRRAPHRLVLPVCESGRLQPVGADELLGLATALLPLGTAGIIASVLVVDDAATVPFMLAVHHRLAGGSPLAEALHRARRDLPDEPLHRATGCSFIALGAS